MKPKQVLKILTDVSMTILLLLMMARNLVGEVAHEWLGIGIFGLFILHHVLNSQWSRHLFVGKYTTFRMLQTVLVVLCLCAMMGSMVSGMVLSRYALSFLSFSSGQWWARIVHMLSAYWGFVFLSLHLGLHWNMMMGMTKRLFRHPSDGRAWTARSIGMLIAIYGVYAFFKREVGSYMLLTNQFVFFDLDEPLILFLLDYMAIMGLFVFIGHYIAEVTRRISKGSKAA